jgi:hypothetical protein
MPSPVQSLKGRFAVAHRDHAPDSPEVTNLRRELAAAKIAQYVEKIVSTAPPLTPDQRSRLAALLTSEAA